MVDFTMNSQTSSSEPVSIGRSYNAAKRHSARVKRMKFALPIAAAVISLSFIAVSVLRSWVPENLSIESATIENGKIVMMKPAVAGRNDAGIAYSMNADRALQDIVQPNIMTLENIIAAVPSGELIARVIAKEGIFDRASNQLEMTAPFEINLSNGIQARFQSADVDLRAGTLSSKEPIAIDTKDGSIVAKTLQIADNGKSITFSGQVRARIAASTIQNAGK
jgi:lipopolysaccharide export system protein LptC